MKKLECFDRVERWILQNARPVDAARHDVLFHGGSADAFLRLLACYQNADGGFGHALEPDLWNPNSTPYVTCAALGLMQSAGCLQADHPMVQGAMRYLHSGAGFEQDQWLFSVPENDLHAHAPWWTYDPGSNGYENIGLTAELAAYALTLCAGDDPLYHTAQRIARTSLDLMMSGAKRGEMGLGGYAALMPHWAQMNIPYAMSDVAARLMALGNASIVRDPALWHEYVPRPSSAIFSPDAPLYRGNEEAIAQELDWLIDTLPQGDVWPLNWSWGPNAERYPSEHALMQVWWKARCATDKLVLLRNFGRIG